MSKSREERYDDNLRGAFKESLDNAKLKLALIKENFDYQEFFKSFLDAYQNRERGVWPVMGFYRFGLAGIRRFIAHPQKGIFEEIVNLVNPDNDMNTVSDKTISEILPRLFYAHAVELIDTGETPPQEAGVMRPVKALNKVEPFERIYKIDLRKKPAQILKEVEGYLDRAHIANRGVWIPDNSRARKEAWTHLKVWRLRKEKKSFSEIARALHMTTAAAKKSFYRACELTQGRRYAPEMLKREIWHSGKYEKEDIKVTCDICPQRATCKTLCPGVLRYISQDYVGQSWTILKEDSDSLKDFLFLQNERGYSPKISSKHFIEEKKGCSLKTPAKHH